MKRVAFLRVRNRKGMITEGVRNCAKIEPIIGRIENKVRERGLI